MKRNWVVALVGALLVVGVGLGATLTIRAANAASRAAPLPVGYNGANGWHQGRARPPVIYIGQSNVFVRTRTGPGGQARPPGPVGNSG